VQGSLKKQQASFFGEGDGYPDRGQAVVIFKKEGEELKAWAQTEQKLEAVPLFQKAR
jgi:hypothetical protein